MVAPAPHAPTSRCISAPGTGLFLVWRAERPPKGEVMCTTTVDGVLVVHEGARRLRWAHELEGSPAPINVREWQIASLWPDQHTRAAIQARLDRGQPVLVILDDEPPLVEFPAEFVPRVPDGVVLADEDRDAGMVTLGLPVLDWLPPTERARGLAFAEEARSILARTSRFLRPPLILEEQAIVARQPLVFAHPARTDGVPRSMLADIVRHAFVRTGDGFELSRNTVRDRQPSAAAVTQELPSQRSATGPIAVAEPCLADAGRALA